MTNNNWQSEINNLHLLLGKLVFTDNHNKCLEVDHAFDLWTGFADKVKKNAGTIYLIGNGASASMASHFAADLAKNAGLHTEVFSDLSLITAISNDISYEHVFSEPLKRRGKKGDILIAISSSGSSPNIIRAVKMASKLGMVSITLSAMSPGNPLRKMGDINAYVPAGSYGYAETCHAAILHHWMDLVCLEQQRGKSKGLSVKR